MASSSRYNYDDVIRNYMGIYKGIYFQNLKAQHCPYYASRASVVVLVFTRARRLLFFLVLFALQTMESSEFSIAQKWPPSYHSAQYL